MNIINEEITKSDLNQTIELFVLTNEKLTQILFDQLSGVLANIPFVNFVIDRHDNNKI